MTGVPSCLRRYTNAAAVGNRSDGFAAHEMFALYHLGRLGFAAEVNERIDAVAQTAWWLCPPCRDVLLGTFPGSPSVRPSPVMTVAPGRRDG